MSKLSSFPPIINNQSHVLILGSMPGVESLRQHQYYANPRNHFWRIIYSLFDLPVEDDYAKKVRFLQERGIGLWDVIATCYREGSLDSDIKDEQVNGFADLFREYPQVKYVCFNGLKAFHTYQKKVGLQQDLIFERLESTSPANTKTFAEKYQNWSIIKSYLHN